jgi:hypothetical protein
MGRGGKFLRAETFVNINIFEAEADNRKKIIKISTQYEHSACASGEE